VQPIHGLNVLSAQEMLVASPIRAPLIRTEEESILILHPRCEAEASAGR
jgi:hypothetical protein